MFSAAEPFRLQELVRVDLTDPSAVRGAETTHLIQALAAYLVIVLVSALPLLLGGRGKAGGSKSPRLQASFSTTLTCRANDEFSAVGTPGQQVTVQYPKQQRKTAFDSRGHNTSN